MGGFATLIWEQWRQTWRGMLLVCAAMFGYWALLKLVEPLVFLVFSNNPNIALAVAYVPVAGAMGILFIQESRHQIGFAYPRRMFWLPVHTYTLVGAQYVFKVAMIALLAAAAGWICSTEIKLTFAIMPQVVLFALLAGALLALVFLSCGFGNGTGLALFIPSAIVALFGMAPLYSAVSRNFTIVMPPSESDLAPYGLTPETYNGYVYPEFETWIWWAAAGALAWWVIVGYLGARHARSEVPGDRVGRWVRTLTNIAYMDSESHTFSSPEAAHRWFEWRRVAYLYPWLTLAVGVLMVVTLRSTYQMEENKFVVMLNLFVVAPAAVAVILGYAMTRPDPRYMWFVGGRPLTSATISRARLVVSIKAIVIAYVLSFIAYTIATFLLFGDANPFNALTTDLELITTTYGQEQNSLVSLSSALWIALLVVWTGFWLGRAAGVIAWISGLLAGAYFYLSGSQIYDVVDSHVVSPIWIAFGGTLTVLAFFSVVATFAIAIRRRLLTPATVGVLVAVLAISAGAVYGYREAFGENPPIAVICVWLLVPLLPFASVPATFEWQRHR